MKSTTLVIMAAGMGSRFGGGIKQLEPMGPNGEIIMDYSIYDAIQAGFNKVVFVTRKDLLETFKEVIGNRIEKVIPVEYALQEIEDIPEGVSVPTGRTKPWGTGQAILACKGIVTDPFVVINADDYYGKEAYKLIHDYLVEDHSSDKQFSFCMAGFILGNTLSDNGGVTRGICIVNEEGNLIGVKETSGIVKTASGAACDDGNGNQEECDINSHVSMNMWGFTPDFLDELESGFKKFLSDLKQDDVKSEYLLPMIVDGLIKENRADVSVLETRDKWFGVTYKEDKPVVVESIRKLIEQGEYPEKLY
ncbi:MAG: nucleotidyltransferase [Lachnospiraceae bacterium]|nr:nucleotidyltransferase [Lachnospiraceae bacterium]